MYVDETHGSTPGKKLSRKHVNMWIMDMVERNSLKQIEGVSLPAKSAKQETDLQDIMEVLEVESRITCIEKNHTAYIETPTTIMPDGVTYLNTAFDYLPHEKDKDWFWFDACGHVLHKGELGESNLETFLHAADRMLKDIGIGFFTAQIFPARIMSAVKQYKMLTGIQRKKVSNVEMVYAYHDLINANMPEKCRHTYTQVYKSVGGLSFVVWGISKGWDAANLHTT